MRFDIPTAITTLIVGPLVVLLLRKTSKFLRAHAGFALDVILWHLGRIFHREWATRVSLRAYARSQLADKDTRILRVPGRNADIPLKVDEVFVPLVLNMASGTAGRFSAATLGTAGSRIVVIGDPGSGKTTLTKVLQRRLCGDERLGAERHQRRLPILLELRDLQPPLNMDKESLGSWLLDSLRKKVALLDGFKMESLFDAYLTGKGLSIHLDGLDEVSTHLYEKITLAVAQLDRQLANTSPRSHVVMTMRTQFYNQVRDQLAAIFPVTLSIQPFTPSDVYHFLATWPFKGQRTTEINRIYEQLTDNPSLSDLCTNPLVLAMYVANDQASDEGAVPPDTRTAFYARVMDELLVRRRAEQTGTPARIALKEQREAILGALAWDNLLDSAQPANSILWADCIAVVAKVYQCDTTEAEAYLADLIRDTGVISSERPGESVHFNHLTFCEFLAANECVVGREGGWDELVQEATRLHHLPARMANNRTRLDELIPFASALTPRKDREHVLSAVWSIGDRTLFARCLLETKAYRHPRVSTFVSIESRHLAATAEHDWDASWLKRLHLFGRVLRDLIAADRDTNISGSAIANEFYVKLVGSSEQRMLKLFSAYAAQDPPAALRLAEDIGVDVVTVAPSLIVENCDQPPFFAMVVERADTGVGDLVAWSNAIVEAGLKFEVVALRAHGVRAQGRIAVAAGAVKRTRRWAVAAPQSLGIFRKSSLYTDCLSISLDRPQVEDIDDRWPMLSKLKDVPPPGRLLHPIFFYWPLALLGLLGLAILVFGIVALIYFFFMMNPTGIPVSSSHEPVPTITAEPVPTDTSPLLPDWGALLVSLAMTGAMIGAALSYVLFPRYRGSVYNRVLNLHRPKSSLKADRRTRWLMQWSLLQRVGTLRSYRAMVALERLRSPSGSILMG